MAYELAPLPYAYNALEPHFDARTMEIHHGKHHQAYVNNTNALLKDHPALFGAQSDEQTSDKNSVYIFQRVGSAGPATQNTE